jgi:hypothetical protein
MRYSENNEQISANRRLSESVADDVLKKTRLSNALLTHNTLTHILKRCIQQTKTCIN